MFIVEDAPEAIGWEESELPIKRGADAVAAEREGAAARRSGKCIWPTFSRFPGSAGVGPKLRYGQVDVKFEICTDRHPSDWKASISAWYNGTASLQGYDFVNEQVDTTSGGSYYRFYKATFKLRDCMPYFAWPCTTKGTFSIEFYAYVVEGKPYVSLQTAKAPAYWSLYKTR